MTNYFTSATEFMDAAARLIQPADSVADIGPGIKPQSYFAPKRHICIEPFQEYAQYITEHFQGKEVHQTDWDGGLKLLQHQTVNSIFLLDVVEHLEKQEALSLMERSKRLITDQMIIFTTLGFLQQTPSDGKDAWGFSGTKDVQTHRSGWYPEDFQDDEYGSWQLLIHEHYHEIDWLTYQKYEIPKGAIWAIYTKHKPKTQEIPQQDSATSKPLTMPASESRYIEIDTTHITPPTKGTDLYQSRMNVVTSFSSGNDCDLSIAVVAYNRFEQTKNCVESLLRYSDDLPYQLYLIDSGSEPEILDYYKSVNHPNKTILRLTKNISSNFAFMTAMQNLHTKYCAIISNDIILTKDAVKNLYTCISSAEDIGWVSPVSTNVSNYQQVDFNVSSIEEMQEQAAIFNRSDPKKWHERMRIMPPLLFYRKACIDVIGGFDYGFFHDFADDDMARRFHRAGYKTILCRDTFVHHNHQYNTTPEATQKLMESLADGRENYRKKYYGLDAWDDFNNFELGLIGQMTPPVSAEPIVLGIDVRAGTPILEMRNKLREYGVFDAASFAFTTQAKYYADLQTICTDVKCDRIEFLNDHFATDKVDYLLLGEPINCYSKPYALFQTLYSFLKKDGCILFKLRNTSDIRNFLYSLGNRTVLREQDLPRYVSLDEFNRFLQTIQVSGITISAEQHHVDLHTIQVVKNIIGSAGQNIQEEDETLKRLLIKDYLFCVKK